MELGKQLVVEFNFEKSCDTLGRWMAHHIAELITATKETKSNAERAVAEERAVQTILKLWEHRMALPGHAYPLAQFKEILGLLSKLTPNANPWHRQPQSQRQQLAQNIYDDMTHLTNLLLSLESSPPHFSSEHKSKLLGSFLPSEEQNIYQAMRQLVGLATNSSEPEGEAVFGNESETPTICQLKRTIARTQADLASLLRVLESKDTDSEDAEDDSLISDY